MIKVKVLKEFISNGVAKKHNVGEIIEWQAIGNFQQLLIDNGFVQPLTGAQSSRTTGFKPKFGEIYFAVGVFGEVFASECKDDEWDHDCYEAGNSFQTKKQAKEAAKRIKETLLKYHKELANE